ncbi:MAG: goxB [Acidimicrobiaceae bacterium]|nr:goxB [Acidimicrobiaceae bacterium]
MTSYDAVVVGSGVIGLTTAWRLAGSGREVALVDAHPAAGASYAAAGMLAPVTEAAWGEEELAELNLRSVAGWPAFAHELEAASGCAVGLRNEGTLLVAADGSDRAYLEELLDYQSSLGFESSWCPAGACRELEPFLAPGVRGGIFAKGDAQVDNRRLLGSLAEAVRRSGVTLVAAAVDAFSTVAGHVAGVWASGRELEAPTVVLAAGWASSEIAGLPPGAVPPVRPVKGQILRLRGAPREPVLTRTIRALAQGSSVYLVPRGDGSVVVGATTEERGDDVSVTAGALYTLLRDAARVVPALHELELVEARAGLRPGSPDNAPLVGPASIDGLVLATGHYRNGILLAPTTAEAVLAVVDHGTLPGWAHACDPGRFAARRADEVAAARYLATTGDGS